MITVSATVTDNVPGAMQSLLALLRNPPVAEIGIRAESGPHPNGDGLSMVRVGAIQEFGAPDAPNPIPQRSFLRRTLDIYGRIYTDAIVQGIKSGVGTSHADRVVRDTVKATAKYYRNDVLRRIDDKINPRNAPMTIARKGFDHPLIETGAMKKAIVWRMR